MADTVFEKVTFYLGLICFGAALLIAIGQLFSHEKDWRTAKLSDLYSSQPNEKIDGVR